jgi:hypothetical protein
MPVPVAGILQSLVGPVIQPLLDRIPNPNERARAAEDLNRAMLTATNAAMNAQSEVNKAQAEHPSVFVAGARPAIMWICAAGVGWQFVFYPIVSWIAFLAGVNLTNAPSLDAAELMALLTGLLGLGAYRTTEKLRGVARNAWQKPDKPANSK